MFRHNPTLVLSLCVAALSFAATAQTSSHTKTPKPDLRAGGFQPSEIVNGVVTDVILPGFHFTGARVDSEERICHLVSFEVASDNEIHMKLKGVRAVDEQESQCSITVRTPAGSASGWLVVNRTEAEEAEYKAHQRTENMKKAAAFVQKSGKSWRLSFAGAPPVTYELVPSEPGEIPTFKSGSGATIQVAVTDDNKVIITQEGCYRSGKLEGTEVKSGTSMGDCTPPGPWTGSVTR